MPLCACVCVARVSEANEQMNTKWKHAHILRSKTNERNYEIHTDMSMEICNEQQW